MAKDKDFEFSILAKFQDKASADLKKFHADMIARFKDAGKGAAGGWSGSFGKNFAKTFGGGGLGSSLMGALGTRPGGIGGWISDIAKSAGGLLTVPMRVMGAFAGMIPGIGAVFGGIVGGVANILSGLIGIAANIAGMVVNVMAAALSRLIGAVEWIVGAVAGVLGKLLKTAAVVGLGVGAAIGFALYKGVQENFKEAQLKAILKRRLGAGMQAAWAEVERIKGASPFGEEELAGAVTTLARGDLKAPAQYLQVIADTATGAKMGLEEVATLFLKIASGEKGAGEAQRTMKIMGFSETQIASIRNVADLAGILKGRFGGIAEEVSRLDPVHRIFQQIKDAVRDLSGGLAELLLPSLNAVADWMQRFRASPQFEKLKNWITEAGAAIQDKLLAGLNWLETRDWTWANFKKGLGGLVDAAKAFGSQLLDMIAFRDPQGKLTAGPLVLGLLAAFKWVALEIEKIFRELWIRVGNNLVNTLANAAGQVGARMKAQALATITAKAAAEWNKSGVLASLEALDLKTQVPGLAITKKWEDQTPEVQQHMLGIYRAGRPIENAPQEAQLLAAKGLEDIGGLAPGHLTPEQIAAQTAAVEADMAPKLLEAANQLAAAQTAIGQMMPSPAGLGAAAANILPALPGAEAGGAPQPGAAAGAPFMGGNMPPELQQLAKQIASKEKVASDLLASGYMQQAVEVSRQAKALREEFTAMANRFVGGMSELGKTLAQIRRDVAALQTGLRTLSTARA